MDYQRARRIRNASLSKIIAEHLAEGQGVGSSFSSAIKIKTRAKIKGIKEKFDPLNVIKFITGSQTLAPALLGRMLGRSKRDIQYFSQGLRNLPTLTKIGKDPSLEKNAELDGINDMLNKIHAFLLLKQQKEIKMRELENNKLEEKMLEDERRHKILMDVLTKRPTLTQTVQKIETEKTWLEKLLEGLGIGRAALTFLSSPLLLSALTTIGVLYMQSMEGGQKTAEAVSKAGDISEPSKQIMEAASDVVQARKNRILSERKGNDWSLNPFKDSDLQKKYLEKIGWDDATGTTKAERDSGVIGLDDAGNPIKSKPETPTKVTPQGGGNLTPQQIPESSTPGGSSSSLQINTPLISSLPNAPEKENMMVSAMSENLVLKMNQELFPGGPNSKAGRDTVLAREGANEINFQKAPIPSVRNTEETFSQVIFERTYVV